MVPAPEVDGVSTAVDPAFLARIAETDRFFFIPDDCFALFLDWKSMIV